MSPVHLPKKPEKRSDQKKTPTIPSPEWRSMVIMAILTIILVIVYTDTYNARETTWLKFKISIVC
jgi:hypothetical protein